MITENWTLFLDRDGIINERIIGGYVTTPNELIIRNDFVLAMKKIAKLFGHIFIITNQQGVAKGIMTEKDLTEIHHLLEEQLQKEGIFIDKIYYCPHLEGESCGCRKPAIGMAEKAKQDFPVIDFAKSVMIGDSLSDIAFGNRAGMKTVLIADSIPKTELDSLLMPDFYFTSIQEFAETIS